MTKQQTRKADSKKIILIYVVAAIICGVFITLMVIKGKLIDKRNEINQKKLNDEQNEKIEIKTKAAYALISLPEGDEALAGSIQGSETVSTDALKGKVILVSQFYSNCPECLSINFTVLKEVHEEFKGNPNFHMINVNVNEALKDPLDDFAVKFAPGAENWWFMQVPDLDAFNDWSVSNNLFARFEKNNRADKHIRPVNHDLSILVFGPDHKLREKVDLYKASRTSYTISGEVKKLKTQEQADEDTNKEKEKLKASIRLSLTEVE